MKTPKVIITYSHDSDEQKERVSELCTILRENGLEEIYCLPEILKTIGSASEAYDLAVLLARANDTVGWKQLVKHIHQNIYESLETCRSELDQQRPNNKLQLFEVIDKTLGIVSPLICVSLAGVESKETEFKDQKSVLHSLFTIVEWNDSNYTGWIDMPNPLRYVYHSLHGGLALKTHQLPLALNIAKEEIRVTYPKSKGMLWKKRELTGGVWFCSNMGPKDHWKHLVDAHKRLEWLPLIFPIKEEYRASLVAYYMTLNIHELATVIASEDEEDLNNYSLKVPLDFLSEKYEIKEQATDILLHNLGVSELWESEGVKQEQMKSSWKFWIDRCKRQFSNDYPSYNYTNGGIHLDHENFFDNL